MVDSEFLPSYFNTSPECPQMDRDEFAPVKQSRQESLRQKLIAHYRKGIEASNQDDASASFPDELANKVAIMLYFFTMISTLLIGVFSVMPVIYEGSDTIVVLQQILVCFIFLEVMVNWLGIRYVNSSYQEYITANGDQHIHKQSKTVLCSTQPQAHTRHSSSVMLMPLQEEREQEYAARKNWALEMDNNARSPDKSCLVSRHELLQEAARVNEWMNARNEQINSKSIADLMRVTDDNNKPMWSSQEQQNLSATNAVETESWISPRPVRKVEGKFVTESYPYWSWAPCYTCGFTRPPRCHHCPLCKTCVLKRDHHCYFAGSCIGYRNHRFFIVFLFWAMIGCVYATLHGIPYMFYFMWSQMSYWDIFFPLAFIRSIFGNLPLLIVLSMTTLSLILVLNCFTAIYLTLQIRLIISGLTSFEKSCLKSSVEIKDTRKFNQKMKAVFGRYWILNFVFPTHFFMKPEEDPVYWPAITVCKH